MNDVLLEVLQLGCRRLISEVQYRVTAEFVDDDLAVHRAGERWFYLGYEHPKMYPGYVIHTRNLNGDEIQFRLKWGSGGQPNIVNYFENYVVGPVVGAAQLIDCLSSDAKSSFERVRHWLEPLPDGSEALLAHVHNAAIHARIADDKSDYLGNDYEQPASDLSKIAQELEGSLRGRNA
jgi:hypothetical protein